MITNRAWTVLREVVERFIRDGQPVASKTLAKESTLHLSPATIRSIMSDLESAGYLTSPHTSAGRMPTSQGYRLFVDHLLTIELPPSNEVPTMIAQWGPHRDPLSLINKTSALLSDLTQCAGLVTIPRHEQMFLKHVEFLPLSEFRVLVILVLNQQKVLNRVIQTDRHYTPSELTEAANYLNCHFVGENVLNIRQKILDKLDEDQHGLTAMAKKVVKITEDSLIEEQQTHFVFAGEAHLLNAVEDGNYQRLKNLLDAFYAKRDILHLLQQSLVAEDIQIFIGEESGHVALDEYSVVTAPYKVEGKVVGVLGVIGPTRMPYSKVISTVGVTAKLLSQVLENE